MDSRHHSIELSGSDAGKKRPRDDDGTMSSELYLAVCEGRKEEAILALLPRQGSGCLVVRRLSNVPSLIFRPSSLAWPHPASSDAPPPPLVLFPARFPTSARLRRSSPPRVAAVPHNHHRRRSHELLRGRVQLLEQLLQLPHIALVLPHLVLPGLGRPRPSRGRRIHRLRPRASPGRRRHGSDHRPRRTGWGWDWRSAVRPLDEASLLAYIRATPALAASLGGRLDALTVNEVGDGNFNFVYIVLSDAGSVVVVKVKQIYRESTGSDSWRSPPMGCDIGAFLANHTEKNRSVVVALNAEIRRTKAKLLEEDLRKLQRLALKKAQRVDTSKAASRQGWGQCDRRAGRAAAGIGTKHGARKNRRHGRMRGAKETALSGHDPRGGVRGDDDDSIWPSWRCAGRRRRPTRGCGSPRRPWGWSSGCRRRTGSGPTLSCSSSCCPPAPTPTPSGHAERCTRLRCTVELDLKNCSSSRWLALC